MCVEIVEADKSNIKGVVRMRNKYHMELATLPIDIHAGVSWLLESALVIRVALKDGKVVGAAYVSRHHYGEVTLFTDIKGEGVGSLLLEAIEGAVGDVVLWAWTPKNNERCQRLFERRGYIATVGTLYRKENKCV